jgi:hypothetical protein
MPPRRARVRLWCGAALLAALALALPLGPASILVSRVGDGTARCEQGTTNVACPVDVLELEITPAGAAVLRQTLPTGCVTDMAAGVEVKAMMGLSLDGTRATLPCWRNSSGLLGEWVGATISPDGSVDTSRSFPAALPITGHSYIAATTDGPASTPGKGNWWVGTYAPPTNPNGASKVLYYGRGGNTPTLLSSGIIPRQFVNASVAGVRGRMVMTASGVNNAVSYFGTSGFPTSGTHTLTGLSATQTQITAHQPIALVFEDDYTLWVTSASESTASENQQFAGLQLYRRPPTGALAAVFTFEQPVFKSPDGDALRGLAGATLPGLGFRLFATSLPPNVSVPSVLWMVDPNGESADGMVWTRLLTSPDTRSMMRSVMSVPVDPSLVTPTGTPAGSPSVGATGTPTPSPTRTSSGTASQAATTTATRTTTPTSSLPRGVSNSGTPASTGTPSASGTPSRSGSPSGSLSVGASPSATPPETLSSSATRSSSPSVSAAATTSVSASPPGTPLATTSPSQSLSAGTSPSRSPSSSPSFGSTPLGEPAPAAKAADSTATIAAAAGGGGGALLLVAVGAYVYSSSSTSAAAASKAAAAKAAAEGAAGATDARGAVAGVNPMLGVRST